MEPSLKNNLILTLFNLLILIMLIFCSIFILNVGIVSESNICNFKKEFLNYFFKRVLLTILLFFIILIYLFLIKKIERKININMSLLKTQWMLIIVFLFLFLGLLNNLLFILNYDCF